MVNPDNDSAVVISGCGWVTPSVSGDPGAVLAGLAAGGGASSEAPGYRAVSEALLDDYPNLPLELKRDRLAWLTGVALDLACQRARLADAPVAEEQTGMVFGCAWAGQLGMIRFADEVRQQSARFVSPIHFPQTVGNYVSGALARSCGIRGPNLTVSSGAASGLDALVEACGLLDGGAAEVVFAGGTDALSPEYAAALVGPEAAVTEAACWMVVERAARVLARGVVPLAFVGSPAVTAPGHGIHVEPAKAIVSAVPDRRPGAICIHEWTGDCLAALGPAAVAAAIEAARGKPVPWVDAAGPHAVEVSSIPREELPMTDRGVRAVAVAESNGTHETAVELIVPV